MNINAIVKAAKQNDLIVTPPVRTWLLRHGDDALSEVVADHIRGLMTTKPRNRSASFSGSAAGMCHRRQELAYAGMGEEAIDPQLRNIFNDGKWRHMRWQSMLLTVGIITHTEYLVEWKRHMSRGSLDGRGIVPMVHPRHDWRGKEFGWELKGVSTFQFGRLKQDGPMPKHMKQVHHYFVLGNFDLFSIVYEDKTTQEFKEWVIEPNPLLLAEAEADIKALASDVRNKSLAPVLAPCLQRKGSEYLSCPYGQNGKCLQATSVVPAPFVLSR